MGKEVVQPKINWKTLDNVLHFNVSYDDVADTFLMQSPKKKPAISIDCNGEYWIRIDTKTGEILGVEIEGFKSVFLKKHPELAKETTGYVRPVTDLINMEMCPA